VASDISVRVSGIASRKSTNPAAATAPSVRKAGLSECLTMCSEMRVPVNCIIGYTELILDNRYGEIPDEVRRVLHRNRASGLQITQAINLVFQPVLSKKEERPPEATQK
jgi:hypothetical protein